MTDEELKIENKELKDELRFYKLLLDQNPPGKLSEMEKLNFNYLETIRRQKSDIDSLQERLFEKGDSPSLELAKAIAVIVKQKEVLETVRDVFAGYVKHHTERGSTEKAKRNQEYLDLLNTVLKGR